MRIKDIIWEDFVNYFKVSTFIIMPYCSFKCDKECGQQVCQNSALAAQPTIDMDDKEIVEQFFKNKISDAIVFGGLEPFDSWEELKDFLIEVEKYLEEHPECAAPDIVIYTGYNKYEIIGELFYLRNYYDLPFVIKFGRFMPYLKPVYDAVLGVELASENQYAARLENLKLEEN